MRGGGGGRRRKEKDGPLIRRGPIRPALLIGIKWKCIGHGLQGHIMDLTKGSCEVHAWRKEEEKDGPLISLRLIGNMLRIRTTPKGEKI